MKTKEQKYQEAVKRNIRGLTAMRWDSNVCYPYQLYKRLGIRPNDTTHDEELEKIIRTKQGVTNGKT